MVLYKTHLMRAYPNKKQEEFLTCAVNARRFVWNWALETSNSEYKQNKKCLSYYDLAAKLVELKKDSNHIWLKGAHAQSLQQCLMDLTSTFKRFVKGICGYPKFKSKKRNSNAFRVPQGVMVSGCGIWIQKAGEIKTRGNPCEYGKIKSATITKDKSGDWHISALTEFEMPDVEVTFDTGNSIGVDIGLKSMAVMSNGESVKPGKFGYKAKSKIKKLHRYLLRKTAGSNRRNKAKAKLAKAYRKSARQRQDFLHKLTADLVKKYDVICIEDLDVKGMVRNKLFSKGLMDASFGEFRRQLEYKAVWNMRKVIAVGQFFPSSKMCGNCEATFKNLKISDRTWTCPNCKTVLDRDLNAANNILKEGLRQLAVGHTEN